LRATVLDSAFNRTPERLAALIEERRELLDGLEQHPERAAREAELADALKLLLDVERLQLLRIDRQSPHDLLDQIVKYEAVHRIRDSRDLSRRTAEDRRCYAFVHPALPGEPLIFTELALTREMSSSVQSILDTESPTVDPATCRCAIFYSISSCHDGLRGVPLGNALIGRVTDELARSLPAVTTFATLSPVQGFHSWLATLARARHDAAGAAAASAIAALRGPRWYDDPVTSAGLEEQLVPLCAYYLLRVTRGADAADPVARFHLRNGARLERINWLGDTSPAGMARSAGLMVNYLYRRTGPGREYDASATAGSVNASPAVERLADRASILFHD
jgi:malonyl-CoA decarboxylase